MNALSSAAVAIDVRNTIDESCQILKLSRATLYKRIAAGLLHVTKDGARTFISGAELERYLAACESGEPT